MTRHVDLLGTLFILWGAVLLLVSLALITLGLGVAAVIVGSGAEETGAALTAGAAIGVFGALAVLSVLCGAAHLWAAFALRRLSDWARAVGIIVAIVDLFVPPIGTALGAYAIWVLTNRDVRALFDVPGA